VSAMANPDAIYVRVARSARLAATGAALLATLCCTSPPEGPKQQTFAAPEDAVKTLAESVKKESLPDVIAIFGPEGQDLIDSSDPASARRSRQVFTIAMAEGWRLVDDGANRKSLVLGHEEWPFPVPLVKDGDAWRFDTASGKEEVLARRIGRNELDVIRACRTYVVAQRVYAKRGHDGKPAGLYAQKFRSDPGQHNGLYWPAGRGEKLSPLGDLVTTAEGNVTSAGQQGPSPFHGYFFKILTAQGPSAPGGQKNYIEKGEMSGGFALIAWPATYDATGIMTFLVSHEGVVYEKDLGAETAALAQAITVFEPDSTWKAVQ
jgi:Protein of unknown function (DUF2950)